MRTIVIALTWLFAPVAALALGAGTAVAVPAATSVLALKNSAIGQAPTSVGYRGYRDYDDDDYYEVPPPAYFAPRVYGYAQRYDYWPERYDPPPANYPAPFVYEWGPPPRPTSCGKYRYWNGEFCADARFRPPYVGPRW
jgi:hypothetical protein